MNVAAADKAAEIGHGKNEHEGFNKGPAKSQFIIELTLQLTEKQGEDNSSPCCNL